MNGRTRKARLIQTKHVSLNVFVCKACWKCVEACSKDVIGKINLFFHKHAKIVNAQNCCGCLKCVKVCPENAFEKLI